MWHSIESVAEGHFLDVEVTKQVAVEHASTLGIVDGRISTWHVDAFVQMVRHQQGIESFHIRKREIQKMRDRGWLQ
jgi:hypothetical protein